MLSENISALRQELLRYADVGIAIAPKGVIQITNLLLIMTLDAAALEQSLISPVAMAPDTLPENVVRIERPKSGAPGGVA